MCLCLRSFENIIKKNIPFISFSALGDDKLEANVCGVKAVVASVCVSVCCVTDSLFCKNMF